MGSCYLRHTSKGEFPMSALGQKRTLMTWLGHRAIQHTPRYTELSHERKDFWRT